LRWTGFQIGLNRNPRFERWRAEVARKLGVKRMIALARAVLLWERAWPALWPGIGLIGLWIILALVGALTILPLAVQLLLELGLIGSGLYFLWRNLSGLALPGWEEGAHRVERDSGLANRPLTEGDDRMEAGQGDPLAEHLWRAHILRLLATIGPLRFSFPRTTMGERDRYRLRNAVLAGLVIGVIVAGSNTGPRLLARLTPAFTGGTQSIVLSAWVSPPDYTGEPPHALVAKPGEPIQIPEGSTLTLRLRGTKALAQLRMSPTPKKSIPRFVSSDAGADASLVLTNNAHVTVRMGWATLGEWRFSVKDDAAPAIAFSEKPSPNERQALKLAYKASDDYGVTKVQAVIQPLDDKSGAKPQALILDLPVPPGNGKPQIAYRDLTGHPYAGLKVSITLIATDAAGHTGKSEAVVMTLPERIFTDPLARALIEQRKLLALRGMAGLEHATNTVDALTVAPERFYKDNSGTYLALRALFWRLSNARNPDDLTSAGDLMWDIAVALEDGDTALAAEALQKVQEQLLSALQHGASQEEIDALTNKLRQAMQRYLEALTKNASAGKAQTLPKDALQLNTKDLDDLLKAIQTLSQTGTRDKAAQLLAALSQLLQNLQVTGGSPSPANQEMNKAVQGLSDLLGGQRELLDKTFRAQNGNGQSQPQGQGQDGKNPQGKTDPNGKGLAQDQKKLRDQLDALGRSLDDAGVEKPGELGRAGEAMKQSQGNLENGQLPQSGDAQQQALAALRSGAQALAQKMLQQNGGTGAGREDPLGRPAGSSGSQLGDDVKVPSQSELQRTRDILQELRRRAAERGRPQEELDYIDRLLKQF
jgi:uncharacterized protein (TIGR02302 family)